MKRDKFNVDWWLLMAGCVLIAIFTSIVIIFVLDKVFGV